MHAGAGRGASKTAARGKARWRDVVDAVDEALRTVFTSRTGWSVSRTSGDQRGEVKWLLGDGKGRSLDISVKNMDGKPVMVVKDSLGNKVEADLPETPLAAFFSTIYVIFPYLLDPGALAAESEASRIAGDRGLEPTIERMLSLYTPVVRGWYRKAAEVIVAGTLAEATSGFKYIPMAEFLDVGKVEGSSLLFSHTGEKILVTVVRRKKSLLGEGSESEPLYTLEYGPERDVASIWVSSEKLAEIKKASLQASRILLFNFFESLIDLLHEKQQLLKRIIVPEDWFRVGDNTGFVYSPLIFELTSIKDLDALRMAFSGTEDGSGGLEEMVERVPDSLPLLLVFLPKTEKRLAEKGIDIACDGCRAYRAVREAGRVVRERMRDVLASILPLAVIVFGGKETATQVVETAASILEGGEPPSLENVYRDPEYRYVRERLEPLYEEARSISDRMRAGEPIGLDDIVIALSYSLATVYLPKIFYKNGKDSNGKPVLENILDLKNDWVAEAVARILLASSIHPFMVSKQVSAWTDMVNYIEEPLKNHRRAATIASAMVLASRILLLDALWAMLIDYYLTNTFFRRGQRGGHKWIKLVSPGRDDAKVVAGNNRKRGIRTATEAALDSLARLAALIETGNPVYTSVEAGTRGDGDTLEIEVKGVSGWRKTYRYTYESIDSPRLFPLKAFKILVPFNERDRDDHLPPLLTMLSRAYIIAAPLAMSHLITESRKALTIRQLFRELGRDIAEIFENMALAVRRNISRLLYSGEDPVRVVEGILDQLLLNKWRRLVIMPRYGENGVEVEVYRGVPGIIRVMLELYRRAEEANGVTGADKEASRVIGGGRFYEDVGSATYIGKAVYFREAVTSLLRTYVLGVAEMATLEMFSVKMNIAGAGGGYSPRRETVTAAILRFRADKKYPVDVVVKSIDKLYRVIDDIVASLKDVVVGFPEEPQVWGVTVKLRRSPTLAHLFRVSTPPEAREHFKKLKELVSSAMKNIMTRGVAVDNGIYVDGRDLIRLLLQELVPHRLSRPKLPSSPRTAPLYSRFAGSGTPPLVLVDYKDSILSIGDKELEERLSRYVTYSSQIYGDVLHPSSIYLVERLLGRKAMGDVEGLKKLIARIAEELVAYIGDTRGSGGRPGELASAI